MKKIFIIMAIGAIGFMVIGCKAWRTVSTTATYTQTTDTNKVTTIINTKTVEEYTGVKK